MKKLLILLFFLYITKLLFSIKSNMPKLTGKRKKRKLNAAEQSQLKKKRRSHYEAQQLFTNKKKKQNSFRHLDFDLLTDGDLPKKHTLTPLSEICKWCDAELFVHESRQKKTTCCNNGKINLPQEKKNTKKTKKIIYIK